MQASTSSVTYAQARYDGYRDRHQSIVAKRHPANPPALLGFDDDCDPPVLSVIIPAYNEESTIGTVLRTLLSLPYPPLDVVVVDDGSLDATASIAEGLAHQDTRVRVIRHEQNRGKGAAIRTALAIVDGEMVVIQDADLEYDPGDLLTMLRLFAQPDVSVVYGSRWLTPRSNSRFTSSYIASLFLSWLTNILFGSRITDEPTCYKMFRTSLLKTLTLEASGFAFCPEITAKVLRLGYVITEIPIRYIPRDVLHGKKITWKDGLIAIYTLFKFHFFWFPAGYTQRSTIP